MKCREASCEHWNKASTFCSLTNSSTSTGALHQQRSTESLTVASLEIGKVLASRKGNRFRAQGYCMYPLIRPGDMLHIEPREVSEIAVGDIAVFRKNGNLIGHRTIAKKLSNGVPCIVTRPDTATHGDDGPTADEHVLGIISSIKRNGKLIDPAKRQYSWFQRKVTALNLQRLELKLELLRLIASQQNLGWYHFFAQTFFSFFSSRLNFTVLIPFAGKWETGIVHRVRIEEFDVASKTWQSSKIKKWRLVLSMGDAQCPIAHGSFAKLPSACPAGPGWYLQEVQVRQRYHGAGFEKLLVQKGKEILARSGMELLQTKHQLKQYQ